MASSTILFLNSMFICDACSSLLYFKATFTASSSDKFWGASGVVCAFSIHGTRAVIKIKTPFFILLLFCLLFSCFSGFRGGKMRAIACLFLFL